MRANAGAAAPRRSSRKPSANITSTRWGAAPACPITRPSRSACSTPAASRVRKAYEVDGHLLLPQLPRGPARPRKIPCRSTTSSRTRKRRVWACRYPPAPCASIRPTRAAMCSSPAKTTSTTRPRTKSQPARRQRLRHCRRAQADRLQEVSAAACYEMEYEITLRNHKTMPITVEVNEPIGGDWEMVDSNYKWTRPRPSPRSLRCPWKKTARRCCATACACTRGACMAAALRAPSSRAANTSLMPHAAAMVSAASGGAAKRGHNAGHNAG